MPVGEERGACPPPALRGFEGRRRVPRQPALYYSPPLINTVPGATAIQEVIENTEWVSQAGNPVAYAPHIRKSPLDGMQAKPVIVQPLFETPIAGPLPETLNFIP